jgi:hypothetical protein
MLTHLPKTLFEGKMEQGAGPDCSDRRALLALTRESNLALDCGDLFVTKREGPHISPRRELTTKGAKFSQFSMNLLNSAWAKPADPRSELIIWRFFDNEISCLFTGPGPAVE